MKKHYRHENDCLNCGTQLEGKFCHNCGQENLQVKENFGHMMNHAISDYFHFDQQFFHTLKPLLLKPGKLTIEYMAGRRAQYLHPVKMYIFISLIYFLLVFKQNNEIVRIQNKPDTKEGLIQAQKSINENKWIPAAQKKITRDEIQKKIDLLDSNKKETAVKKDPGRQNYSGFTTTTSDTSYQQYVESQKKLPEAKQDGWFKRYYNKKAFALNSSKTDIKELIGEGIKHNFPKMMFFLLPLFALILRVTFWKNKKFYVEHLIYAFHLHCFVFLFLTIIMVVKMGIPVNWGTLLSWLNFLTTIAVLFYIYRSLRVVYHRSRLRTITKMIGMSFVYSFVFSICLVLLIIVTTLTVV
ncbi:DUF3667 domain-containing protein [soil metagenome]|jgi:hypothetical protein